MVATLRSDFLSVFQSQPALLGLEVELLPVGPMAVEDVAEVIEGPARVAGLELETGLVQAMLADTGSNDALPLLAFTLRELWEHGRADGRLDVAEYRERGALHHTLGRAAEDVITTLSLSSDQQQALRRAFIAMVRLGDDDRRVRHAVRWNDLPVGVHPTLERFVQARLLVSSVDGGVRTVEVAHEALIRSWDRLAGWLDQSADALRLRRTLHSAAEAWDAGGRAETDLWRGARLAQAADLAEAGDVALDERDERFVRSRAGPSAEHDARERSRRRRLQIFAGVAVFSLLLATVATVSFVRARRESDRATQQARASAALALATQSRDADSQNPALGLALAADAILTTDVPLPQAEAALSIAYGAFVNRATQQIGSPLVGSDGADDVAFSPDGARLASSHADGGVRSWDSQTGRSIGEPIPGLAGTLEFSPDGTLLASTSDRSVRLWNLVTNEAVGPSLEGDYVEFSPDGSLLATVDAFSRIHLWNPTTGDPIREPIEARYGYVNDMRFSGDGDRLITATSDGALWTIDPATGETIGDPLQDLTDLTNSVELSPNGDVVAFYGSNGMLGLVDSATGERTRTMAMDGRDDVEQVAFGPDGHLVASVLADGSIKFWSTASGQPVGRPLRSYPARGMAFSPDGRRFATVSADGSLVLWDPVRPASIAASALGGTRALDLSADGTMLATANSDTTVRLWDQASGASIGEPLRAHDDSVTDVAFSPDGRVVASASGDETVRLWDPTTGRLIGGPLRGHTDRVTSIAFSPDGDVLVSASSDGRYGCGIPRSAPRSQAGRRQREWDR